MATLAIGMIAYEIEVTMGLGDAGLHGNLAFHQLGIGFRWGGGVRPWLEVLMLRELIAAAGDWPRGYRRLGGRASAVVAIAGSEVTRP